MHFNVSLNVLLVSNRAALLLQECHAVSYKLVSLMIPTALLSPSQNVVLISIASVMDPSLAPPGKHCLHAYLPATEPFSLWEGLDRKRQVPQECRWERGILTSEFSTAKSNFRMLSFYFWKLLGRRNILANQMMQKS